MIPKINDENAHHNEGVLNLWQWNLTIANPESDVDLRNYQVTNTVVVPLTFVMGYLLHHTLNLPQFIIANFPSPEFVLDRHRRNINRCFLMITLK